jgi:hypothetical protein
MPKLRQMLLPLLAITLTQAFLTLRAQAKSPVPSVRLDVTARAPVFGGQQFGPHGSYEQITGKAHMRIDPLATANRGIVDLALAPRAADGMVDYDIDFVIQRPSDPAKARSVLLYDVVNRGMRLLSMMTGGSMMNPDDPGDGLLMRHGYTLVWSGWQGDITHAAMMGARFPVATNQGETITGQISTEIIFDDATSHKIALPYAAAMLDQANVTVTVRALADSPEQAIAASDWHFDDNRHISLIRPATTDAGAIYRVRYTAKDPWVMGLGFAATRDFISWLRHAPASQNNPLADLAAAPCERNAKGKCANPQGGAFSSVVAFGVSQSGRYLRDFLWQGFNRDLTGNRVFDGVIALIPGGRRTFTNHRFAEPSRFSRQHEDHDVPGFTFPFSYTSLPDPNTGHTDGILVSCTATATCPKIFHIDTSAEFWQAGASLVGTGGTDHDLAFPANVRAYMISGGAHAPGMAFPGCHYPVNALDYTPLVRAMVINMVDWTTRGTEPPANRWPSLAQGELQPINSLKGPAVPAVGLVWPKLINRAIPPAGKPAWPAYVLAIDADGNDTPGIRLPEVAAPMGTYLGWNLRKAGFGEGDLHFPCGSYLPFAKDAASRGGDTRQSLAERYPGPGSRARQFKEAVDQLRADRLLLLEDANAMLRD